MGGRLTFLGHSTVLVDLDGVRVLTDPLLGHMAAGAIRRQVSPVLPDTLGGLSAVFISHGHWDHLDMASLKALPGDPALIVPVGLGRVVARATRGAVHEMRAGDRLQVGQLTLEVVHAEHSGRRSAFTTAESALGVLIIGSTSVYFAGDTDLFPGMERLSVVSPSSSPASPPTLRSRMPSRGLPDASTWRFCRWPGGVPDSGAAI